MSSGSHGVLGGDGHYIGIDVGTGSARACVINSTGDIKAVASKNIRTWQPKPEYYVRPSWVTFAISQLINYRNNQHLIYGTAYPLVFNKFYPRAQSNPAQSTALVSAPLALWRSLLTIPMSPSQ